MIRSFLYLLLENYKNFFYFSCNMKVLKIIGGILAGIVIVPIALALALSVGSIVVVIVLIVKLIRLITLAELRKKKKSKKEEKEEN